MTVQSEVNHQSKMISAFPVAVTSKYPNLMPQLIEEQYAMQLHQQQQQRSDCYCSGYLRILTAA